MAEYNPDNVENPFEAPAKEEPWVNPKSIISDALSGAITAVLIVVLMKVVGQKQ